MERAPRCVVAAAVAALAGCATGAADSPADRNPPDAGQPWWSGADAGEPPPPTPPPAQADAGRSDGPPATCSGPSGNFNGIQAIECVPDGVTGPAPLVVVLHGYTLDPQKMLAASQWDVLAGRYGFYVVFPQSSPDFRSWYWYTPGRSRGQADPAGIVAIVDDMKARYDIDETRVFVAGFSSGGYMTVDLLADYPDVFAAGSATSGGPHGCDVLCPHAAGGVTPSGQAIRAELPGVWDDPSARKPQLMILHGDLDETNLPSNSEHLRAQWLDARGADDVPDNAELGVPTELKGYPYEVYEQGGEIVLAYVHLTDLGHGTPVDPGDGVDQGGYDETPSKTADSCAVCPQDWTNTGTLYGAYYEAKFFGIIP